MAHRARLAEIDQSLRDVFDAYARDLNQRVATKGNAIPVIVGGDHSLMYPDVVAVTDVYGKGKVGVIHFDAHFDGIPLLFGHYLSHGAPVRRVIDELGLVDRAVMIGSVASSPLPQQAAARGGGSSSARAPRASNDSTSSRSPPSQAAA